MPRYRYGGVDRAALDLLDSPRAVYMFQVSHASVAPARGVKHSGPVTAFKHGPPVAAHKHGSPVGTGL